MKALINRIIPFSSVDGPGNRTVIFFQGCNMNCTYCHNPETRKHCRHCGICIDHCPSNALTWDSNGRVHYDPEICTQCDTCIRVCPYDSTPKAIEMTPEEVYQKVKKQIPFIRGITVSGGECMLEWEFIKKLFQYAKEDGLTTLIDSNGSVSFEQFPELLEVTDGVMLDIKVMDESEHKKVTELSNKETLKNAVFLAKKGKLQETRTVIAPDLYQVRENIQQLGEFLLPLQKETKFLVKLIAYRPEGVRKCFADQKVPDREYMESLEDLLTQQGIENIMIIK